jgi:TonB family protein
VYSSADVNVVPPMIIRQFLPAIPTTTALPANAQGVIEVVIDETGAVESATMRVQLNPAYDRQAVIAAKTWLYKPATYNGVPVKFRKAVQIALQR